MSITISKLCRAGRDHAALKAGNGWSSLDYVGTMRVPAGDDGPAYTLEMRNCACHSTLCREVDESDDTVVIDAPELVDTRTLLSQRERHHDRCMAPGDDGHLTCPVVAGRGE